MFAMLFTVGIGYFIFVDQGVLSSLSAQRVRDQAVATASSEMLSMKVALSSVTGDLGLQVANTGKVPSTLVDVFIVNTTSSRIACNTCTVNVSLPLTIAPGMSTAMMTGCGHAVGCGIGISYQYTAGYPVEVSVVTSTGNVFSAQYPPKITSTTTTTTLTTTTVVTSTLPGGNPGGAILVVQMVATPPQTFACSHCVNDTVTVYNYGPNQVTGVSLSPSVPLVQSTGTLLVASIGPCTLKGGQNTISAYSGSGPVPHIVYLCTYNANPNGFGGFASFEGTATGTYNLLPTTSGEAISNTIQIGGPVNVLNQGPFSANFFYFKYSACTNAPTGSQPGGGGSAGSYKYSPSCTSTPSPVTIGNLLTASLLSHSDYYVAFYAQVTNDYNVTIAILPYSYFLTDPTIGGESPFYIVGNPSSLPYVPNYTPGGNGIPTLTPYPSSCIATSTSTCINVPPGGTVTLTFAACDITSTWWDWGGGTGQSAGGTTEYGWHDPGNTCTTNSPAYTATEATWLDILVSFVYNGQVYTQGIPFVGQKVF
jgi:hypothetical protein